MTQRNTLNWSKTILYVTMFLPGFANAAESPQQTIQHILNSAFFQQTKGFTKQTLQSMMGDPFKAPEFKQEARTRLALLALLTSLNNINHTHQKGREALESLAQEALKQLNALQTNDKNGKDYKNCALAPLQIIFEALHKQRRCPGTKYPGSISNIDQIFFGSSIESRIRAAAYASALLQQLQLNNKKHLTGLNLRGRRPWR